jgi:undecaprenyl-diphosphatase
MSGRSDPHAAFDLASLAGRRRSHALTRGFSLSHMTYPEAIVIGLFQGVTELFPVSSLGHSVLIPALVGGSWATDLNVASSSSAYLAFIVGLHVATAIGIAVYFWRDWLRIIGAFFSSIIRRELRSADQRLAWMLVLATIPVGLAGFAGQKEFQKLFAVPVRAAIFLIINGLILYAGERFRTRKSRQADADLEQQQEAEAADPQARPVAGHASGQRASRLAELAQAEASDQRLASMGMGKAVLIGCAQILALFAGISRDGVTMVAGMFSGLSREDAARFAFLLATPVILAAGLLKVKDLTGPLGNGIHGQILVGSVLSGVGAYISVRFLVRYFRTRTLTPFAIYCVVVGLGSALYLHFK